MSRSYKGIRLKKHRVYSVDDLMEAYSVCRNTISNWVRWGLEPSVKRRPKLFRGATVQEFHRARRERSRTELRLGEFKCMGCKMAVFSTSNSIASRPSRSGALFLRGLCPDCGAVIHKLGTQADLDAIDINDNPNISEDSAHEENTSTPVCIGNSMGIGHSPNDYVIYSWQSYAGKFSEKTLDRHLTAIRQFEAFLGDKPFKDLTRNDCYAMRDSLKAFLAPGASRPKSKSSVQHFVSHLKDFLGWLRKQEGYKQLPLDLTDALDLPRAVYGKSLPREHKAYPSLEEAEDLLVHMSDRTVLDKRKRAIFALAFLGALRADTLISLRLGNIDLSDRKIIQDARTTRTKNGKSLVIAWFPIAEAFSVAVWEWINFMTRGGFGLNDALFPPERAFNGLRKSRKFGIHPVPPMTSTHAVTQAFLEACRGHHTSYTPHAAKHTIAAERDRRQLTAEQRKAWSENMGHESEQITNMHYGKLSAERRFDLVAKMPEGCDPTNFEDFSSEEKAAFFDEVVAKIRANK